MNCLVRSAGPTPTGIQPPGTKSHHRLANFAGSECQTSDYHSVIQSRKISIPLVRLVPVRSVAVRSVPGRLVVLFPNRSHQPPHLRDSTYLQHDQPHLIKPCRSTKAGVKQPSRSQNQVHRIVCRADTTIQHGNFRVSKVR